MSRIGKKPIVVPKGVEVNFTAPKVKVKGPKGALEKNLHESMAVTVQDGKVNVTPKRDGREWRKFHGLTRTLVANMVKGVTEGFSKSLTLVGVGYRAQSAGKNVTLSLGYSHPIEFTPPPGIEIKVEKQTTLVISGAEKEMVGQVAATIRGMKPPEPYHGKGVRYENEVIATKVGKAAGKK